MKDLITTILNYEYLVPITILIFLCYIMLIIGRSIFNIFKNVGCCKGVLFIFAVLSLILQMIILDGGKLVPPDYNEIILYLVSLFSFSIVTFLFSQRKKIKNDDFIILVGVTILIQSAISMIISSSNGYSFNIKLIHSILYITLPAFCIYEVSNNKKDFLELNDKLNILQKEMQRSCSNLVKKENTHKCMFLYKIKRKNK